MDCSTLCAGDTSPIVSLPVPDTCATSCLCGDDLIVSIFVVAGTEFDLEAVSEGRIDIALEKEGPMAFLLLRFQTLQQISYMMSAFDALNTPSNLCSSRVLRNFNSGSVGLRIWTQDESSIIQTIRHSRLPANLQGFLQPIVRRQMRKGQAIDFYRGSEMMIRFMQRAGRTSLAFDRAKMKSRVS